MNRKQSRQKRRRRIRKMVSGTAEKPRLCIFISLKNMQAQVIDDASGKTIVSADLKEAKAKNTIEGAEELGKLIAKKCAGKKVKTVVFDRGGYKYHGKIKSFAEGARKDGLAF